MRAIMLRSLLVDMKLDHILPLLMLAALALRTYRDRGTVVNEGAGPAEQLGDPFAGEAGHDS